MADHNQNLKNRRSIQQFISSQGPGNAMDLYNGIDLGFLTLECVICTKNMDGFICLNYAKQSQLPNGQNDCKHL